MAKASLKVAEALRTTAAIIEKSTEYHWGHMGLCNCGFLAQTITKLSKAEIHAYAMRKCGDWSDYSLDYCPTSQMPFDLIIGEMIAFGFEPEDLIHLERLSDENILKQLPDKERFLKHNSKSDVVVYMTTWASCLERTIENSISSKEHLELAVG